MCRYDVTVTDEAAQGQEDLTAKQLAATEAFVFSSNMKQVQNGLARKSIAALRALCGFAPLSVPNETVQRIVLALLTPFPYHLTLRNNTSALLRTLTSNVHNPVVMWDEGMRSQLRAALDRPLDGPELTDSEIQSLCDMQYAEVKAELVIDNIFIRRYNEVRVLCQYRCLHIVTHVSLE